MYIESRMKHHYTDSCLTGLGEYSNEGWAWRFFIPYKLQGRASNNSHKHIAGFITHRIDMIKVSLKPLGCFVSMGDSIASEGWNWKTNFKRITKNQPKLRSELRQQENTEEDFKNTSSHIIANCLWEKTASWQWHSPGNDRSKKELTIFCVYFTLIGSKALYQIVPLSKEISSWLILLLQRLPERSSHGKYTQGPR